MTEAVFDLNRADPDALKLQRPLHDGKLGGGTQRKSAGAEQESVGYFSTKANPVRQGRRDFATRANLVQNRRFGGQDRR